MQSLPSFQDIRYIEPLIGALKDEYEHVRTAAIGVLREIGDEGAISALEWAGQNYTAKYPDEYNFKDATDAAIARIWERQLK